MARKVKRNTYDSKLKNFNRYYSNGAVAAKVMEDEPAKTVKKKIRKNTPAKQNIGYRKKLSLVFYVTVVFACAIAIMFTSANRVYLEMNISELKNQLKDIKDQNTTLKVQIYEQIDLKHVEDIAINELGMVKPESYQIVYIDVAKISNMVVFDELEKKTPEKFSIWDLFKKD